jgi:membrane-associated phospholipid phosphatase
MARPGRPLEPPSGRQGEVALSRMYRGMHYPTDVLAGALLGAGWLAVTVRGIRLGVRHHELRAETAEKNPERPAPWRPLPRHG